MFFRQRSGSVEWMLVFLGNPGTKYDGTRHNVGWSVGDVIAERCGTPIRRLKNRALTARCTLGGREVLLVKPQTYMNLSGEAVRPRADFYKIPPERILVVSDEIALAPGRIRLRPGGSAGGHNGLKSIIQHLGTDRFPRLQLGVGAPPQKAADALECCVRDGIDTAMNRYNG